MISGEDEIVAWFSSQSRLSAESIPIGIGDDMAQIRLPGGDSVLVTTDMLLDGVHFDLRSATLEQVGYKAMAVSLSDCAAMATIPLAAVVSVALPRSVGGEGLRQLHAGISGAADRFACPLVGGDITAWQGDGRLAVKVAMLIRPGSTPPVRRDAAKAGEAICVTGSLGGSRGGKHLAFEPRLAQAQRLAEMTRIGAMIDISDGLSMDLHRMCRASGVGAVINADRIPIGEAAQETDKPLAAALGDGEDFELLFTLAESDCEQLLASWDDAVPITRIGETTELQNVEVVMPGGRVVELKPEGYNHLRRP